MFQKNKKQDEEYMGRYWEAVKKNMSLFLR